MFSYIYDMERHHFTSSFKVSDKPLCETLLVLDLVALPALPTELYGRSGVKAKHHSPTITHDGRLWGGDWTLNLFYLFTLIAHVVVAGHGYSAHFGISKYEIASANSSSLVHLPGIYSEFGSAPQGGASTVSYRG